MQTKLINVDFFYYDLNSCSRCQGTHASLIAALNELKKILQPIGYEFTVQKIWLNGDQVGGRKDIQLSPTIKVNGSDIGFEQMENECSDCTCIQGDQTNCRTWLFEGKVFDIPPTKLFMNRILQTIYYPAKNDFMKTQLEVPKKRFQVNQKIEDESCCETTCCS